MRRPPLRYPHPPLARFSQAFNYTIALVAVPIVWSRSPRGALLMIAMFLLLLILDIVFYATQPWRSATAMGFTAFNTILKVPIIFLFHVFLHELGGSYSLNVPTSADAGSVGMGSGPTTAFVGGPPASASAPKDAEASAEVNFSSYQGTV